MHNQEDSPSSSWMFDPSPWRPLSAKHGSILHINWGLCQYGQFLHCPGVRPYCVCSPQSTVHSLSGFGSVQCFSKLWSKFCVMVAQFTFLDMTWGKQKDAHRPTVTNIWQIVLNSIFKNLCETLKPWITYISTFVPHFKTHFEWRAVYIPMVNIPIKDNM